MKVHVETLDGKLIVTVGETRFVLTETTADVQSSQAVLVKVSSPEPVVKPASVPRRNAYDLPDPNHPMRNVLTRKKMLS